MDDALGNVVGELDKPVVELAKVAEHESPHDAELVAEVLLATADAVEQVVVAARARAVRRQTVGGHCVPAARSVSCSFLAYSLCSII